MITGGIQPKPIAFNQLTSGKITAANNNTTAITGQISMVLALTILASLADYQGTTFLLIG